MIVVFYGKQQEKSSNFYDINRSPETEYKIYNHLYF